MSTRPAKSTTSDIALVAKRFGLADIYVFGSRAEEFVRRDNAGDIEPLLNAFLSWLRPNADKVDHRI